MPVIDLKVGVAFTELVFDHLYAISTFVALDGSVSWALAVPGRFQLVSCYFVVEGGRVLLIDTGVVAHGSRMVAVLREVLLHGVDLSVVLIWAEMDCVFGLGGVAKEFVIGQLMAGGAANPFDAFQEVGKQLGS